MGRLRSGLFVTALVTITGLMAFAGCSADGAATDDLGPLTEPAPNEPSTPLQPGSSGGASSSGGDTDPGTPDPKKPDGGTKKPDAGDPPPTQHPETGDPCAQDGDVYERPCGACGTQTAVCETREGNRVWSVYGDCSGELAGGCIPGTTQTEACGNCGTRTVTCNKYCAWNAANCLGEPPNSCPPNSVELVAAGCGANEYRSKTCKADCTYEPVSLTCEAPPKVVNVAPTVNSVSSTIVILSSGQTIKAITGSCPNPSVSTINVAYDYIQVKNPLPKAATVSIWNSAAPAGGVVDTTLAAYNGVEAPSDRKGCMQMYTSSSATLTGDTKFAALTDTRKVTVPASGTITVYVGGANAAAEGPVKLTVRTESVAP